MPQGTTSLSNVGADEFRLRNFIETLIAADELEIVETPTELADLTSYMDGNRKAVLFQKAGPEEAEIIGNVGPSRSRLALAFGVAETDLLSELLKRLNTKQPIGVIDKDNAPVQQCGPYPLGTAYSLPTHSGGPVVYNEIYFFLVQKSPYHQLVSGIDSLPQFIKQ